MDGLPAPPPRILVIDAHPAVRQGLVLVLEAEGLGSCLEAEGCAQALEIAAASPPDMALVGLSMDQEDTVRLVSALHSRSVRVLVCSQQERPSLVRGALAAGARAYLTKSEAPREIVRAVRDVLAGWILISPCAAEGLQEQGWWKWLSSRRPPSGVTPLPGTNGTAPVPVSGAARNNGTSETQDYRRVER